MDGALYVDTSAVLRALLEAGTSADIEAQVQAASHLVTSRLALLESARAFLRVRSLGEVPERTLADAERAAAAIWSRCTVWELTPAVCDLASRVAPAQRLRALDALHLATYLTARRHIEGLKMLTTDERLIRALESN